MARNPKNTANFPETPEEINEDNTFDKYSDDICEVKQDSIIEYGRGNLHPTLLENLTRSFKSFTKVQRKAIPTILSGKDALIKSQTGSGKTLAAIVPVVDFLLKNADSFSEYDLKAFVIAPTTELVLQTTRVLQSLVGGSSGVSRITVKDAKGIESGSANIIVTKPSVAVLYAESELKSLKFVVLDEADLLFEYGFKSETLALAKSLRARGRRKSFQAILLSATLSEDVKKLAELLLYKSILINVEYTPEMGQINEFYLVIPGFEDKDKILCLYTLLKMQVLPFPCIIFVNDNFVGHKLKTVLGKLSIDSRLLSGLLSVRMRDSLIQSFNQGIIELLIIADIATKGQEGECEKSIRLSRGIDFKNVKCILNYDTPGNRKTYIHRIGRCGRKGDIGVSITFFDSNDPLLEELLAIGKLRKIELDEVAVRPLKYRVEDVYGNVTKRLVGISQMQAVRQSALLEEEFISKISCRDHSLLDAVIKLDDQSLKTEKVHLAHLPDYLIKQQLKRNVQDAKCQIGLADTSEGKKRRTKIKKESNRKRKRKTRQKYKNKKQPVFKRRKK